MAEIKLVNTDYTKPTTSGIKLVNTDYTKPESTANSVSSHGAVSIDNTPASKPLNLTGDQYKVAVSNNAAINETFKSLSPTIKEITSQYDVHDRTGDFKLGIMSSAKKQADEEKYNTLFQVNAKELGIKNDDLLTTNPNAKNNHNRVSEKFVADLQHIQNKTPDEISAFIKEKKKSLGLVQQREEEANPSPSFFEHPIDAIKDWWSGDSEYTKLYSDLDALGQNMANKSVPKLYKNIDQVMKLPTSELLKVTAQEGNDILNVTNDSKRALFKARADINIPGKESINQMDKDQKAYVGIQSEIQAAQYELQKDGEFLTEKLKQINALSKSLEADPTNKDLVAQIQGLGAEIDPLKASTAKKKAFIQKLFSATLELPEFNKQLKEQEAADLRDEELNQQWGNNVVSKSINVAGKELWNGLAIKGFKLGASLYDKLGAKIGLESQEDSDVRQQNLWENDDLEFTLPSRIKNSQAVEWDENGDWHINAEMMGGAIIKTTAEAITMAAVATAATPEAMVGTLAGDFLGLYAGSTAVFGGTILESELAKGASFGEAMAFTGVRLGVEALTERFNFIEKIPFKGLTKNIVGKSMNKQDFINFVGKNYKTLFPKWKSMGIDVLKFLAYTGKNAGMETIEEVMSDLGNFGIDQYTINNIKGDYRPDNKFDVQNETTTVITTMLSMLPMAGRTAVHEIKADKYAPNLRWKASQTPDLFLTSLADNLKNGLITQEFHDIGVRQVENSKDLYNLHKAKIDMVSNDKKADYLDALYQYNELSHQLLNETDESEEGDVKRGKLVDKIQKARARVEVYDKEALPLVGNPVAQQQKKEEIHIENIKDFASPEVLKQSSIEDLLHAKSILQTTVDSPASEKVGQEAQKHIDAIDAEISLKTEEAKPYEQKVEELEQKTKTAIDSLPKDKDGNIVDVNSFDAINKEHEKALKELNLKYPEKTSATPTVTDGLSDIDYASQVIKMSEEDVNKADDEKTLKEVVLKHRETTAANIKNTEDFETAKGITNKEERRKALKALKLKHLKEGNTAELLKVHKELEKETDDAEEVFGKRPADILNEKKAEIEKQRKEALDKLDKDSGRRRQSDEAEVIAINEEFNKKLKDLDPQTTTETKTGINIISTPSADIIAELNKLNTFQEKLEWLKKNNLLAPITINGKTTNVIDYEGRVMVLMKLGKYNVPFYISTGQAGKKNVKAGNWYAIFGIGEEGWINKGSEAQINTQYDSPILQKFAKILNEGIGTIESREEKGKLKEGIGFLGDSKEEIEEFNKNTNFTTKPAANNTEVKQFYAHATDVLTSLNEEMARLNKELQDKAPNQKKQVTEDKEKTGIEGQIGNSKYSIIEGLIFYNNPNGTITPVVNPKKEDPIKVITDDIERRRQEELKQNFLFFNPQGKVTKEKLSEKDRLAQEEDEANRVEEINAKYDAELAALEEKKEETELPEEEEKEKVISPQDLELLAKEKFGDKDNILLDRNLQKLAKRVTGVKHISKMSEGQRAQMKKALDDLPSKQERIQQKKQKISEERGKNLKEIKTSGVLSTLSRGVRAVWNNVTNRYSFFTAKGDNIVSVKEIVEYTKELSSKIGVLRVWWEDMLTDEQRQDVVDLVKSYRASEEKFYRSGGAEQKAGHILLLGMLVGKKFNISDKRHVPNANAKVWLDSKASSINDFVHNYIVNNPDASVLSTKDESDLSNDIISIIDAYPDGVTKEDIRKEEEKLNISNESERIKEEFAETFGIDIDAVVGKYEDEIETFEKITEEEEDEEEEEEEEEDVDKEEEEEEDTTEEDAPTGDSEEAEDLAKKAKEKQEEEKRKHFTNGKDRNLSWKNVVSKIAKAFFGKTNKYTVSVINANKVKFEDLPGSEGFEDSGTKYWNGELAKAKKTNSSITMQELRDQRNLQNNDKYLVITDENGDFLYFDEKGNETTEDKGQLALAKMPWIGNKFLQFARESRTKTTFTIIGVSTEEIPNKSGGLSQLVSDYFNNNGIDLKTIGIKTKGKETFISEKGKSTQIFTRNLTNNEIDTVIAITKIPGGNRNEREARLNYIKELIYSGLSTPINFKFNNSSPNSTIDAILKNGEVLDEERLRRYLKGQVINVGSKNLGKPFTTFKLEGKLVKEDKTYSDYKEFIISNFTIKADNPESIDRVILELGAPADSMTGKVEQAIKEERQEGVEDFVEKETPTKIEQDPLIKNGVTDVTEKTNKKEKGKEELEEENDSLFRSKFLSTETTEEQEAEAEKWIKNSPLFQLKDELRILTNVVNSDAFATYKNAVITLWKSGKFTDLYHEAWHKFSQLHLTKEQKRRLYKEAGESEGGKEAIRQHAKKLNKDVKNLTELERFFAIEEYVAEDFRKYAIAFKEGKALILNQKPHRNTTFRKIMNFFRAIFKRDDLQTYYEKLYTGNISKYERNLNNQFFTALNKGYTSIDKSKTLSNEETKDMYKSINSIISSVFDEINKKNLEKGVDKIIPVSTMFDKGNLVAPEIYKRVLNKIKLRKNSLIDDLELISDESVKESVQKEIDNLDFMIQNWNGENGIVKNHPKYSSDFKSVKLPSDYLKTEEEEENENEKIVQQSEEETITGAEEDIETPETDQPDTSDDEAVARGEDITQNSNKFSLEAADKETVALIATLHKYVGKTPVFNKFLPSVQDVVDFRSTWDEITKNLNNTLNYSQIIAKLKEMGKVNETYNELVSKLPSPDKQGSMLTNEEHFLKAKFINDISKPSIPMHELVVTSKDGKITSITYSLVQATDKKKLTDTWGAAFNLFTPETSPYRKYDKDNVSYLDLKSFVNDPKWIGINPTLEEYKKLSEEGKLKLFNDRVEYLSNIGVVFAESTLGSPEFIKFMTAVNTMNNIENILKEAAKKNLPVKSYKDLDKGTEIKVSGNNKMYFSSAKEEKSIIAPFINQELAASQKFFQQSVKNAEGNSEWLIKQWNYMSKVYNALNDIETYPDFEAIQKDPWLSQFNIEKNPYARGIILETLFDLKDPSSPNYGKRRFVTDAKGNAIKKNGKIVYPTIALNNYSGLKLNLGFSGTNEGRTTTGLSSFDKIIQNINSLLTKNVQEHLRYGDKSSAFGTSFSHILVLENGQYKLVEVGTAERGSIIPLSSFNKLNEENKKVPDALPREALRILRDYLVSEIIPMQRNVLHQTGNSFTNYKDNIKSLGIFETIISKENKDRIQKEIVENPKELSFEEIKAIVNTMPLSADFEKYIQKGYNNLLKNLDTEGELKGGDILDPSLLRLNKEQNRNVDEIYYAYVVNSLIYNIEHTKIVTQDPRFYKVSVDKETKVKNFLDFFKRIQAFLGDGNIFVVDNQTNNFIASRGEAIRDAVAAKLGITIDDGESNGTIRSIIFKDNEYAATELINKYVKHLIEKGYSNEYLKQVLRAYNKINEADGQGYVTLDEFRKSKMRAGSSHWTKAHEEAYQKEAAFLRGESTESLTEKEVALFMPQKWQYGGITVKDGVSAPVYYKFSVVPLIPSVIKNTPLEAIHENMVKQRVGLATFESGSKTSSIQNEGGGFNSFYENYENRTPFTGEYTINPIFYQYLKEQVNIDPSLKGKVSFSTQMRKLLFLNTFANGVADKKEFAQLDKRFTEVINHIVDMEKTSVLKKMGAVYNKETKEYTLDDRKLSEFLQKEFEERGLPDEIINYLQVNKETGKFPYSLDASLKRAQIDNVLMSIVNNRLIKQKINGGLLIQVAATGMEFNDSRKFDNVQESSDLRGYEPPDIIGKDANGKPIYGASKAMQIKIAWNKKWEPLFNLTHPDGQKIGNSDNYQKNVDRVNEALKNEKWQEANRDKISIVGVRIPVQGLNSQEFMEVFHFLPEAAGGVIYMHPSIVAKSGGDFDIDKLTTFFPHLNKNGDLYRPATKAEKVELLKKQSQLTNILKSIGETLDKTEDLKVSISEEIDAFLEDLLDESNTKVIDAKRSLAQTHKYISKLESKSDKTFQEIEKLTAEIEQINNRKGYENELISIIKKVLSSPENFFQLIRPNDIDLLKSMDFEKFKSLSQDKDYENSFASCVDFNECAKQFNSNLVGKSNLSIGAVMNVYFSLSQRAGLILNDTYELYSNKGKLLKLLDKKGKEIPRRVRMHLAHNTVMKDGKKFISISGQNSFREDYPISDIFSQMINGYLEVAKDDWIFYINAVRELLPTMLFTTMAGVNAKTMIAFYNQPIMNQYLKQVGKYKSLFMKIKDPASYNFAKSKAINNVLIATKGISDPELTTLINNLSNEIAKNESLINSKASKQSLSSQGYKVYQANVTVLTYLQNEAEKHKDLFTYENLSENAHGEKKYTPEENLMLLAHFVELEQMAKINSSLQRSVSADTKALKSTAQIEQRQGVKGAVERSKLIQQEGIDKLFNESNVSAFTHTEKGNDSFIKSLYANVFSVTNHREFNRILGNVIKNSALLKYSNKQTNLGKFSTIVKNDFISYLYQTNIREEDKLVAKEIFKALRKGAGSFTNELFLFKQKYPNLFTEFPILSKLIVDAETSTPKNRIINPKSNLRFSKKLDATEANSAVQQIRALLSYNNSEYTSEQQLEIQAFAKKYTQFAIIQSGMNPSIFDLTDSVPNETYSQDINKFIMDFKDVLNNPTVKDEEGYSYNRAEKVVKEFWKIFEQEHPSFFDAESEKTGKDDDGNEYKISLKKQPQRGVNYTSSRAVELSTEEQILMSQIKQDYYDKIPTLFSTYEGKENGLGFAAAIIKPENADNLILIEDTQADLRGSKIKTKKSFSSLYTKDKDSKAFSDDTLNENKTIIDKQIEVIKNAAFAKKAKKILFNSFGYGQMLKETAPQTFQYLSQRLFEEFGYTNPNSELELVAGKKIIDETDVNRFNSYISKSQYLPKEFFTEHTRFSEFYNNDLGRKANAPQTAMWVLNSRNYYDLIDKESGELYIANVDLKTGIQYNSKEVVEQPEQIVTEKQEVIEQPIQNKELKSITPKVNITNYRTMDDKSKEDAMNGVEEAQKRWVEEEIAEFYEAIEQYNKGLDTFSSKGVNKGKATMDDVIDETLGIFRTIQMFPKFSNAILPYLNDIKTALNTFGRKEGYAVYKAKKDAKGQAKEMTYASLFETVDKFVEQPINKEIKPNELQKQNIFTVKPIQSADKKAIVKASIANKYIGFGEGITNSSTELYRKQVNEEYNKAVKEANARPSTTNIPQNLQSGVEQYGTLQYANKEAQNLLGKNVTSIELIENGFRTRTTRTDSELLKYDIKVGSYIKMFGKDQFGNTKNIIVKITKITKGYNDGTWYKEGWTEEGLEKLKKHTNSANAVEFEVVEPRANTGNYSSNDVVFVSVPGKRGTEVQQKTQQDRTIKEAIKAVEAGATILTDNKSYIDSNPYNTGEKRLYANMEANGYNYSEQTIDGQVLGIWNKNQPTDIKPKIDSSNKSQEIRDLESTIATYEKLLATPGTRDTGIAEQLLKRAKDKLFKLTQEQPIVEETKMVLKDGNSYEKSKINTKLLESIGYTPVEIGKILKEIC